MLRYYQGLSQIPEGLGYDYTRRQLLIPADWTEASLGNYLGDHGTKSGNVVVDTWERLHLSEGTNTSRCFVMKPLIVQNIKMTVQLGRFGPKRCRKPTNSPKSTLPYIILGQIQNTNHRPNSRVSNPLYSTSPAKAPQIQLHHVQTTRRHWHHRSTSMYLQISSSPISLAVLTS